MKIEDYPSLYRSADEASSSFQKIYVILFWSDLVLMIVAGILGFSQSVLTGKLSRWLGILAVICVIASVLLKLVTRTRKDDSIWFDCRAIAESVKTTAWRYMTGAPPFDIDLNDEEADKTVVKQIGKIREQKSYIASKLSLFGNEGEMITEKMREVRKLSFDGRNSFYLAQRVKPEQHWYADRARFNSKASEKVFWTTIILLSAAGAFGIYQINEPDSPNIIAIFVIAASARMAWGEMRRYKELAQSYAVAASELTSAAALWIHIKDNSEFVRDVVQCEEAISREHTMWIAKRVI